MTWEQCDLLPKMCHTFLKCLTFWKASLELNLFCIEIWPNNDDFYLIIYQWAPPNLIKTMIQKMFLYSLIQIEVLCFVLYYQIWTHAEVSSLGSDKIKILKNIALFAGRFILRTVELALKIVGGAVLVVLCAGIIFTCIFLYKQLNRLGKWTNQSLSYFVHTIIWLILINNLISLIVANTVDLDVCCQKSNWYSWI